MGAPFNIFENNSQPVEGAGDQSKESSTLSNSLWQEIGSTLSTHVGSDKSVADPADTSSLDFGLHEIYGGRKTDPAGAPLDVTKAIADPVRFVPSERLDARPLYAGELIFRDVEPVLYTATKAETLHEVARGHLGRGASQEQIDSHVREIAALNGLSENDRVTEGQFLDLPGHTADGGHIILDYHENKRTTWQDGRELLAIDNQSSMDSDKLGEDAVQELYLSTWESTDPSHLEVMADYADEQLMLGKDEHFAELDLLRLQHDADLVGLQPMEKWAKANPTSTFAGLMNLGVAVAKLDADDRYDKALAEKVVEIEKRREVEEAQGRVDEIVSEKVEHKLRDILRAIPEERQAKIAGLVRGRLADWDFNAPVNPTVNVAQRFSWWNQLKTHE